MSTKFVKIGTRGLSLLYYIESIIMLYFCSSEAGGYPSCHPPPPPPFLYKTQLCLCNCKNRDSLFTLCLHNHVVVASQFSSFILAIYRCACNNLSNKICTIPQYKEIIIVTRNPRGSSLTPIHAQAIVSSSS